ncbi:MAG: DUF998 domain-containing protein [Mycobacterium sp.]
MTRFITGVRRRRLTAAGIWIGCGLCYLAAEAAAAARIPGYSYAVEYISDLGIPGHSPAAGLMNTGFIVQGVGFILAGTLVFTTVRRSAETTACLVLGVLYGIGSGVVGLVHGGGDGAAHVAHIGGATAAIVAGNLGLIGVGAVLLKRGRQLLGAASAVLGAAGLTSAVLLVRPGIVGDVPWEGGAWERGSVYTIIAWQLAAAAVLLSQGNRRSAHS